MISFSEGNHIAEEFGMRFEAPGWPEELNAHVFHEDKMTANFCWIQHTFYLADSIDDCIDRKLVAKEDERAEIETR